MLVHKYNSYYYVAYKLSWTDLNDAVFPTNSIFYLTSYIYLVTSNIYIQLKEKSMRTNWVVIFLARLFNQVASLQFWKKNQNTKKIIYLWTL